MADEKIDRKRKTGLQGKRFKSEEERADAYAYTIAEMEKELKMYEQRLAQARETKKQILNATKNPKHPDVIDIQKRIDSLAGICAQVSFSIAGIKHAKALSAALEAKQGILTGHTKKKHDESLEMKLMLRILREELKQQLAWAEPGARVPLGGVRHSTEELVMAPQRWARMFMAWKKARRHEIRLKASKLRPSSKSKRPSSPKHPH